MLHRCNILSTDAPEPFSFTYSLYICEYASPVGASVFAGGFLVARDLAKTKVKTEN